MSGSRTAYLFEIMLQFPCVGSIVDVMCEADRPCMYLVRWGKQTPSWHDATEIMTHPFLPF